jgi:hypothetical protein
MHLSEVTVHILAPIHRHEAYEILFLRVDNFCFSY